MTHLPFIVASYGITLITIIVLSVGAARRLRRARAQLASLEKITHQS